MGIGAAIVKALATAGVDVFTTYYRPYDATMTWGSEPTEAEAILAELRAMGVQAAGMEVDLADVAAPAQLFDEVAKQLGPVTILVNNATHSVNVGIEGLTAAFARPTLCRECAGHGFIVCRVCATISACGAWGKRPYHQHHLRPRHRANAERATLRRHQRRSRCFYGNAECRSGGAGHYG